LVFAHPLLTVTTILYAVLVPWLTFMVLRTFELTVGEALLACTLLVASPGFLSNLFTYIRPGKPLSFILLAYTALWLARHAKQSSIPALAGIVAVLVVGNFTDEILYWNAFFVAACLLLLSGSWRRAAVVAVLPTVIFAVLLFAIMPSLYDHLGLNGPRSFSFESPEHEYPSARMLGYLISPQFYGAAFIVAARSLAVHVGAVAFVGTWIAAAMTTLIGSLMILVVTFGRRQSTTWQLAAVALFGFVSFTAAGTWLQWYVRPGYLTNHIALNWYYNSPASLFVAMLAGAGIKAFRSRFPAGAWVACTAVVLAAVSSVATFQHINDVFRFRHLGPTDTRSIFAALNATSPLPSSAIVTGDAARFEREFNRYNDLGLRLFGPEWPGTELYVPREYFLGRMNWFGPSYAAFGEQYGQGLCLAFVRSDCPIQIREKGGE
jgi:hypothetical protein